MEPLLTPRFVGNASAQYELTPSLALALSSRHVARSYLANSGDARFVTPPATTADGSVTWTLRRSSLSLQIINLTNARVFPSGSTDGITRFFYVQPPRSFFLTARVKL